MVFLPASFVAGAFGMNITEVNPGSRGTLHCHSNTVCPSVSFSTKPYSRSLFETSQAYLGDDLDYHDSAKQKNFFGRWGKGYKHFGPPSMAVCLCQTALDEGATEIWETDQGSKDLISKKMVHPYRCHHVLIVGIASFILRKTFNYIHIFINGIFSNIVEPPIPIQGTIHKII